MIMAKTGVEIRKCISLTNFLVIKVTREHSICLGHDYLSCLKYRYLFYLIRDITVTIFAKIKTRSNDFNEDKFFFIDISNYTTVY